MTPRTLEHTRRAAEWVFAAAETVVKLPGCRRPAGWLYDLHIDLQARWLRELREMVDHAEEHANWSDDQ